MAAFQSRNYFVIILIRSVFKGNSTNHITIQDVSQSIPAADFHIPGDGPGSVRTEPDLGGETAGVLGHDGRLCLE